MKKQAEQPDAYANLLENLKRYDSISRIAGSGEVLNEQTGLYLNCLNDILLSTAQIVKGQNVSLRDIEKKYKELKKEKASIPTLREYIHTLIGTGMNPIVDEIFFDLGSDLTQDLVETKRKSLLGAIQGYIKAKKENLDVLSTFAKQIMEEYDTVLQAYIQANIVAETEDIAETVENMVTSMNKEKRKLEGNN